MRSSSGAHYLALDHLRALAALMVFSWHFLHFISGTPVPFSQAPLIFPLALFDEGHVGVSLFMTLSGYLFAKLLDGKRIIYSKFLWNRALRLFPLLFFVIFIKFILILLESDFKASAEFLKSIPAGVILPTLPNGGWSITAELHFYLLLPLLLAISRQSSLGLLAIIICGVLFRTIIYTQQGTVQNIAYFTIIGRIDQFSLGIIAHQITSSSALTKRLAHASLLFFMIFYWIFDYMGGFMKSPSYPSSNPIWIIMSTIEGLFFAILIRWYDTLKSIPQGKISKFIGRIGGYSYSIYLLHMFFVFDISKFIHENIMVISNFYLALAWSIGAFILTLPISILSYTLIEMPFMKWRKYYIKP